MALGQHKIEYEVLAGWEQLPEGWAFVEVAGVACDSHDQVYVFNRGAHPVMVFDKEGKFLNAWGEGLFKGPHGIFIDRHDHLWLADDKDHTVRKFTPDGKVLMTLGESGKAADTGYKIGESPVLRSFPRRTSRPGRLGGGHSLPGPPPRRPGRTSDGRRPPSSTPASLVAGASRSLSLAPIRTRW